MMMGMFNYSSIQHNNLHLFPKLLYHIRVENKLFLLDTARYLALILFITTQVHR